MAYSVVAYTGDGANTTFAIPFPFISRDHVSAKVDGISKAISWVNDGLVQVSPAPAAGASLIISRDSSRNAPIVDFQDAQVLTEADLDMANLQVLYVAQEAFDASEASEVAQQVHDDATAAAASALAAANSATDAAASVILATTQAVAASGFATAATAAAASIGNVMHTDLANSTTVSFRATLVPNGTYDLASGTVATSWRVSGPATVPSNKTLTALYADGAYTLGVGASFTPYLADVITDPTSDPGGSLYAYKANVTLDSSGSGYGFYSSVNGPTTNGAAIPYAYPMYLRISADTVPVYGTLMTMEVAGPQFKGYGLEVKGTGDVPSIVYPIVVRETVGVTGGCFWWSAQASNSSDFLLYSAVGDTEFRFRVDYTGACFPASVSSLGPIQGASVAAVGAVTGGSVAATGAVTGTTVAATATVTAPVVNATTVGATTVNATTVNATNVVTTGAFTGPVCDKGGEVFNVKAYGALGDNTNDDTAAIQAAVNAAVAARGQVFLPGGVYKITAAINLSGNNVAFIGAGQASTILNQFTANAKCINNTGTANQINNLGIQYNGTPVAGATAIDVTGPNAALANIRITSSYVGIKFSGGTGGSTGTGLMVSGFVSSGIWLTNCLEIFLDQFVLVAGSATNGADGNLRITEFVEGCVFHTGDIISGVRPLAISAASYTLANRPAYLNFTDIYFDSGAQGALVSQCVESEFIGCWFSNGRTGIGFNGLTLTQTDSLKFTNCRLFNAGAHGCQVSASAVRTVFTACAFESCSVITGSGVSHGLQFDTGCTGFVVTGCIFNNGLYTGGQQGYGVYIWTGCTNYTVANNVYTGNVTGPIQDLSAAQKFAVDPSTGAASFLSTIVGPSITVTNTGAQGAAIKLVGAGTTPAKFIRARAGLLEFVNDANSAVIASLTDVGALSVSAAVGATGYWVAGSQILGSRKTGWTTPTGTGSKAGYSTLSATTTQVAQTLKALIDDLISHGIIGA